MGMKLYKQVCKLSNIKRFAALKLDREYSVAEHSYRVAMMCIILVDEYNSLETTSESMKISREETIMKALFHDLEESIVGDIPTPVKQIEGVREVIRMASEKIMKEQILDDNLPNKAEYLKMWVEDKDGETGQVILLADKLEALLAAAYELKRGNKDLQKAFNNIRAWFDTGKAKVLMEKFPVSQEYLVVADEVPQSFESIKLVG